jgi:large subunit ribosomal protein L32e
MGIESKKTLKQDDKKKKALLSYRTLLKKRKPRFLRHKWFSLPSLGKGKKKKQKWRQPKGRHNKLREKRKGRGKHPSVGFSSPRLVRSTIAGMKPVVVRNVDDLKKISESKENVIAFLASVGMKKKMEIANKALSLGIDFANFNPKLFLEQTKKELERRKEERKLKEIKAKERIEKTKKVKEKKESKEKPSGGESKIQIQKKIEEKEIIKPKSNN